MLSVESMNLSNPGESVVLHHMSHQVQSKMGNEERNEPPVAFVTSTPLPSNPIAPISEEGSSNRNMAAMGSVGPHGNASMPMMPREIKTEIDEKNAIISSLFEEIRLEATYFPAAAPPKENNTEKKLMKRKSELTLEMTAEDLDDILGDSTSSNFNPKHPFGPSPSGISNGFGEVNSPSSSYRSATPNTTKSSPPLSKYSQNNQGQRNSPQSQQSYQQMSSYQQQMNPNAVQMGSPMHPQLQQQPSMTSSPPTAVGMTMHSPVTNMLNSPLAMHSPMANGHHPLHIPHHTRLLQHQQSAPNLRHGVFDDVPHVQQQQQQQQQLVQSSRPFDATLVDEFGLAVRAIMMASNRIQCRNVYRQLTAEVSELYSRVVKNQVPKKAVKKIVAVRTQCTPNECFELERQFKCLSDGLESRRSSQLYESIVHFLFKMRIAIPDASSQ